MRKTILLLCACITLSAFAADNASMKQFNGEKYRYTISYPSDWRVYDRNDGTVVFKEITHGSVYPSSVNIQTIYTKKAKGTYKNIKALMDDFVGQASKSVQDVKFLDRKPLTLVEADGTRISGEEAIMSFSDHGRKLKQWQVMVMTNDGKLFQAWAYRASDRNFDANLGVAKEMLHSWKIR